MTIVQQVGSERVKQMPWYIPLRADAYAVLLLSGRKDLIVREKQDGETGPALTCEIVENGQPTGKRLAVAARGTTKPLTAAETARLLDSTGDRQRYVEAGLPLCAFLFDVKQNQAKYAWAVEPVVTADGNPRLEVVRSPTAAQLNPAAVGELVSRLARWYDALGKLLSA
jgi:hypothetical protein